jgi:L-threonylcarbamoyladenylate synthase
MKFYSNIFKATKKNILKASLLIKSGTVVAIPTETVYGLAGNALKSSAVKKIYQLKKRPKHNPLIVHFSSLEAIKQIAVVHPDCIKLAKKFSPGPITYVLPIKKNSGISPLVLNSKKQIACRIPNHKTFLSILKQSEVPIAAPSANMSNAVSTLRAVDVHKEFGSKIKMILDTNKIKIGLESTVIKFGTTIQILRPGAITKEMLEKTLRKKVSLPAKFKTIEAPGQMKKHYSPGIPVYLNQKKEKPNGALLVFGRYKLKGRHIFYLSKKSSLEEAAKNLYVLLRTAKEKGFKNISVHPIPNKGIGRAINDRLTRAAG